ncbi:hypothetical protein GOP47_0013371 [Adiantum capillus-veneris]|uniref:Uncharacterized protein n=1 Tax=Adiantum capillus-veneris TaxID=13818 RepID=A0A9D4UNL8_ADICA|nr:hypothetical protein GOP47_0013371 [Adiantum capillus-veneris]
MIESCEIRFEAEWEVSKFADKRLSEGGDARRIRLLMLQPHAAAALHRIAQGIGSYGGVGGSCYFLYAENCAQHRNTYCMLCWLREHCEVVP